MATGPLEAVGDDVGPSRLRVELHLIASAAAFARGNTEPGETCEMVGVGPVPVSVARAVFDDAFVNLVLTDGVDVTHVARVGRRRTAELREALFIRDRQCVVPGCDRTAGLEAHHLVPVAVGNETRLDILSRICDHHHDLVTHRGYLLNGGPGSWQLVPPGGLLDTG